MWEPVPWMVAGGHHSANVARVLAYVASAGGAGVVGNADCKVTPTAVPSQAVLVRPGAVAIPNRKPGAAYESYIGRQLEAETVTLTPTGSSGPRTDLIVARVEDPEFPSTPEPSNPEDGPYIFTRVIEDVPANTTSLSDVTGHYGDAGIALARVTRPASTGTVLAGHITDLRTLAQARTRHETRTLALLDSDVDIMDTAAVGGETWPDAAGWYLDVPPWATHARVVATWAQIVAPAGDHRGFLWVRCGSPDLDGAPTTQTVGFNTQLSTDSSRETYVCADEVEIPSEFRDTRLWFNLRAKGEYSSDASARIRADGGSAVALTVDFYDKPQ